MHTRTKIKSTCDQITAPATAWGRLRLLPQRKPGSCFRPKRNRPPPPRPHHRLFQSNLFLQKVRVSGVKGEALGRGGVRKLPSPRVIPRRGSSLSTTAAAYSNFNGVIRTALNKIIILSAVTFAHTRRCLRRRHRRRRCSALFLLLFCETLAPKTKQHQH